MEIGVSAKNVHIETEVLRVFARYALRSEMSLLDVNCPSVFRRGSKLFAV
jgi:hypothetical protein